MTNHDKWLVTGVILFMIMTAFAVALWNRKRLTPVGNPQSTEAPWSRKLE